MNGILTRNVTYHIHLFDIGLKSDDLKTHKYIIYYKTLRLHRKYLRWYRALQLFDEMEKVVGIAPNITCPGYQSTIPVQDTSPGYQSRIPSRIPVQDTSPGY